MLRALPVHVDDSSQWSDVDVPGYVYTRGPRRCIVDRVVRVAANASSYLLSVGFMGIECSSYV